MTSKTKQNKKPTSPQIEHADWVRDIFTCEGLGPHNRSIEWLLRTFEDLDVKIDRTAERYRHNSGESFQFTISSLSGMVYRVSVTYQPRQARLLAKRFGELDLRSKKHVQTLLYSFQGILTFDVHWFDARDGAMEHICIERNRKEKSKYWPGDHLVAVTKILADDLRSSLEYPMTTLRNTLISAYPIAWANEQTPDGVTMAHVQRHVDYLKKLKKLEMKKDRKDDFMAVQTTALKELFNEEVA